MQFFSEERVGVFTKDLSMVLSVSFNRFSTKNTTFCGKSDNFAYFLTSILPTNISHTDWLI